MSLPSCESSLQELRWPDHRLLTPGNTSLDSSFPGEKVEKCIVFLSIQDSLKIIEPSSSTHCKGRGQRANFSFCQMTCSVVKALIGREVLRTAPLPSFAAPRQHLRAPKWFLETRERWIQLNSMRHGQCRSLSSSPL